MVFLLWYFYGTFWNHVPTYQKLNQLIDVTLTICTGCVTCGNASPTLFAGSFYARQKYNC